MAYTRLQGYDGPVQLTGNSPELDEFAIRIVDGQLMHSIGLPALRPACVQDLTTSMSRADRTLTIIPTA